VLWLDSERHSEVEELGAGNVFFVRDGVLITPPLFDSVLEGVTRDSILTTAQEMGLPTEVRPVEIDDAIAEIRSGRITEMFTCGTAAVISPVGTLVSETDELQVGSGQVGPVTADLRTRLHAILYGETPDPHGWLVQASP
jgi:branched-chain amino acid aminotransferase